MIAVLGTTKSCLVKCEQQRPKAAKTRSHTHVPAWLAERLWCTQFQSSLLNIYFRPSGFQSSLLLIHFRYGLNTCSYCTKEWHRTYPICDSPLSWSVRRSFATSQKSRCHNRSCVWKDALSDVIFVAVQKLSAVVWTQAKTPRIQTILSLAPSGLKEEDGLIKKHSLVSVHWFPQLGVRLVVWEFIRVKNISKPLVCRDIQLEKDRKSNETIRKQIGCC